MSMARHAPFDRAEIPAMRAERRPSGGLATTDAAPIGRILRRRRGSTRQPHPRRRQIIVLGLLELGHQAADAWTSVALGGANRSKMPPRLAPEPRLQRRLCQRDVAFGVISLLRGQCLEALHALQRSLIGEQGAIG